MSSKDTADNATTALLRTPSAATNDAALFAKAQPSIVGAVFPVTWLWRWFTRRTGWGYHLSATDAFNAVDPFARIVADSILYGEGPRFRARERAVYFSDMYSGRVLKVDITTQRIDVVCEAIDHPSGLGWLPDGRLVISSGTTKRQVLAFDAHTKSLSVYADMTDVTRIQSNDMVVHPSGQLYVGNFGFDHTNPLACTSTTLVRVDINRNVHVEATKMLFPNGSVITPDGKTLIVAETFAAVLTAFDIAADGSLSNRRVWANVGAPPDGICLDADGCVWVAVPQIGLYKTCGGLVRVREGGDVVDVVGFGQNGVRNSVYACQLTTDANGKHALFFLEAATSDEHALQQLSPAEQARNAVLKSIPVQVGPAVSTTSADYSGGYC